MLAGNCFSRRWEYSSKTEIRQVYAHKTLLELDDKDINKHHFTDGKYHEEVKIG
jgi:hypothetical protein